MRIWSNGAWTEVKLVSYEINNEPQVVYPPKVVKLYEQGIQAFHNGRYDEQNASIGKSSRSNHSRDAHYNLGAALGAQGKVNQAKVMFQKAIELKPLYAMPRCQLAGLLLGGNDIAGAKEIILPLLGMHDISTQWKLPSTYIHKHASLRRKKNMSKRS